MDGTTLRTADSPANREHFGAQVYPPGKIASYPQVRAVTLTAIPTHLVAHIRFGCATASARNGVRQRPAGADTGRFTHGVRQGLYGR